MTSDDTLDLSSPLLLRSESDEGVKDWFESNGRRECDSIEGQESFDATYMFEEKILTVFASISTMLQCGFLISSYFLPWLDTFVELNTGASFNWALVSILFPIQSQQQLLTS